MSLSFLVGAIIGSFVFIVGGRRLAQGLLEVVQTRTVGRRRKP